MGIDDIRGNFVNFYENGLKSGVCSNVNSEKMIVTIFLQLHCSKIQHFSFIKASPSFTV